MRLLLLSALSAASISLAAVPALAQEDDASSRKMELAREYSALLPMEREVEETINQLAMQVPVAQRVMFRTVLERSIKVDRLQAASELALTELFTVEELGALVAFYSTEEGQSISKKLPEYQARLQSVLEQMVVDAATALQQQGPNPSTR